MAQFISTAPQTLASVGDSIVFNSTNTSCNCNIRHRDGSAIIRLKGNGCCCNRARYRVSFHGNVSGLASGIQFAIYIDGEQLPETLMSVVPAAATDVLSVDADTEIYVDCDCAVLSVKTATAGVTVDTASIIINRIA